MLDFHPTRHALPPAAVAKLYEMQDQADAALGKSRVLTDRVREASEELRAFRDQPMDALEFARAVGRRPGPEEMERIARQPAAKEAALAEVRRRQERADAAREEWNTAGNALRAVQEWVKDRPGVAFRPFAGTLPAAIHKGETVQAAVARLRGEIAEKRADLNHIASALLTSVECKAAIQREIEALAEAGTPDVGLVMEGRPIGWPRHNIHVHPNGHVVAWDAIDTRVVLTWFLKPQLLTRLEAEVDVVADDKAALSSVQRRTEDARVRAEMLVVERLEEVAISAAPPGLLIPRRIDADPRAVLGLADDVPAATDA